MGAREQPLLLIISTAGSNLAGPCREDWRNCEKLLDGAFDDERHFAIIYTLDEGLDWTSEAALQMANPNWNVSINPDMILPAQQEAIRDAAKQAVFKTKHLNLWVNASNGWVNMQKWNACARPDLKLEDFAGRECWIGIDAAAKVDVFSMVAVFEHDGGIAVFARHFMPEDTVAKPENAHMRKWVAQGHMTQTEGARTDQRHIETVLREWSEKFYIQEVAYDPKEISYLMNQVRDWAGFPCIEINQGPALMSEPTKELEAKIQTGKLYHNGDPVLTWMASNAILKTARGGGAVKYQMLGKERGENKIDGIVALVMAISRQMNSNGSSAGMGFG
jgi:phage terminase large subunit-like protein